MELVMQWLVNVRGVNAKVVAAALASDWMASGRNDVPEFLRAYDVEAARGARSVAASGLKRQQRRLTGAASR
jgi:hypothetical protein